MILLSHRSPDCTVATLDRVHHFLQRFVGFMRLVRIIGGLVIVGGDRHRVGIDGKWNETREDQGQYQQYNCRRENLVHAIGSFPSRGAIENTPHLS